MDQKWYFLLNNIWLYGNLVMILPFMTACFFRFRNRSLNKPLLTDHLCRACLIFTCLFYAADIYVKYHFDGAISVCQKGFMVHHISSLLIILPLVFNEHIPWWVNPIGFMHGFNIYFSEIEELNYIYAVFVFIFQYGLYQKPYYHFRGYFLTRIFVNGVWIFALLLLANDCSNFMPLEPYE